MRVRASGRTSLLGILALSTLTLSAPWAPAPAFAEDPVALDGAYVVDRVGALGGDVHVTARRLRAEIPCG